MRAEHRAAHRHRAGAPAPRAKPPLAPGRLLRVKYLLLGGSPPDPHCWGWVNLGPGSRSRKSPSGLDGINPGKDAKAEGTLSKGRGEARCARSSLRYPKANVLGFFFYLLVLKIITIIIIIKKCHGTARALRRLETPVPKRDPNRCAAARPSSQHGGRRAAPAGRAAGARRARREPVAGAPRGGVRCPRCKAQTVGPKPLCPVRRARLPPWAWP